MIGFTMLETCGSGDPLVQEIPIYIYFTTNTCNTCYLYRNLNLSSLLRLDEFVVICFRHRAGRKADASSMFQGEVFGVSGGFLCGEPTYFC